MEYLDTGIGRVLISKTFTPVESIPVNIALLIILQAGFSSLLITTKEFFGRIVPKAAPILVAISGVISIFILPEMPLYPNKDFLHWLPQIMLLLTMVPVSTVLLGHILTPLFINTLSPIVVLSPIVTPSSIFVAVLMLHLLPIMEEKIVTFLPI